MKKSNHRRKSSIRSSGFTILELIVVIVIIGILATVTITTYIGTVPSARDVSVQSDLSNASDQLVIDQAQASDHKFPIDLAHASATIKFSGSTTNTYVVDNTDTPKTFCLTATNNNQTYFITQEGKPLPGPCPVLYLDAGIATSYPGTGTAWNDLSGLGNNGALVGGVTYGSGNGGSLSFGGAGDYVNAGNNSSLMPASAVTVAAWIKSSASVDYRTVLSKGYDATDGGFALRITRDSEPIMAMFQVYNTSGTLVGVGSYNDISNNNWYYVVGTYDGSNVRLFVNGAQIGATAPLTGNIKSNSLPVKIGVMSTASAFTEYFSGQISDIRIYNKALSSVEITQSFSTLRSRYGL